MVLSIEERKILQNTLRDQRRRMIVALQQAQHNTPNDKYGLMSKEKNLNILDSLLIKLRMGGLLSCSG